MYLQYGCGWCAPDGWTNFDASPTLRFERLPLLGRLYTRNVERFPESVRYGDIVKGLPVPDASCEGVYCSHILEHLSRNDFDRALRETFRILKPGGIFRLVVPDLEAAARAYVAALDKGEANSNDAFMRATSLGVESRRRGLRGLAMATLGNSNHLWMWDWPSIERALLANGFAKVRQATFGDSEDAMFRAVEDEARFAAACAAQAIKA